MNKKYAFVKNKMNYDEVFIPYLEDMSRKGWELESLHSIAKFKKCNHELKYQIDYNPLSYEYKELLDSLGYKHVACTLDRHIYCNENLDAEDLSSDEDILVQSKLKMFPRWAIIFELICTFVLIVIGYNLTDWFHFSLGSIYMYTDLYLCSFIYYEISVFLILLCINLIIKRNLIKKNKYDYNSNKYLDICTNVISSIFILTVLLTAIFLLNDSLLPIIISSAIFLIIYEIYGRIIQNIIPTFLNKNKRKILTIVAVIGYLVVFNFNDVIIDKLHLSNNRSSDISINLPENKTNDGSWFSSPVLKNICFNEFVGYDEMNEKEYSDERYYLCNSYNIAREVYQELVVDQERIERYPSEEEIDNIVNQKGSFTSDDVKYKTYNEAKKNCKVLNTKNFDECLKVGNYSIGIKNNIVVKLYNYDIDVFYENL